MIDRAADKETLVNYIGETKQTRNPYWSVDIASIVGGNNHYTTRSDPMGLAVATLMKVS